MLNYHNAPPDPNDNSLMEILKNIKDSMPDYVINVQNQSARNATSNIQAQYCKILKVRMSIALNRILGH